ncbi:topoisomerase II-associated protein PAT1 [Cokeromyces recurvatus]|uniref:topoisomerase II-associated protein PAT1 n=1 Tax=Cokeromyces recurvatus TaxID=90255 RepID=UPI00221F8DFC|nr:topoisomerase II-associated protein PAT1 [Cokeromyces recurvatus]KAI7898347.1 topoisomerase II-associated protein PAT1 [Cokeromyces recurvatus]
MGDTFFGFNTNLPPLTNEEFRALAEQGIDKNKDSKQTETYDNVDADVYDFAALRQEFGVDEDQEENDGLGDQLIEEGDDYNDLTFGDDPVGQDFDFSGNTQRFTAGITDEEAFFVKRKPQNDQQAKQSSFHNFWSATPVRHAGIGRGFGEASPISSSKSIWGNFTSGLSPADNTGFSSLSSSQSNLSPFLVANRQAIRPQQQPQQSFMDGMSPTISAGFPQQQHTPQQQQQQPSHQLRPVTLEDIEADIQRQQAANRYRMNSESPLMNGKPLSLADLEAALTAGNPRSQQQMQQQTSEHGMSPFGFGQPDPIQILAMKQQQELKEQLSIARELKRRELQRKSQYDGLMTQHDKDLVNRIQLSQLASGDPYADDFYYQVYTSLRQSAGLPLQPTMMTHNSNTNENGRSNGRGRRDENMMQRMQQQLQRIVNEAKRRPKQTQVSLEGALGKITSLTVRNPRQVLQVPQTSGGSNHISSSEPNTPKSDHVTNSLSASSASPGIIDRRHVLKIIEDMYIIVLELEQMRRCGPQFSSSTEEEGEEKDDYKDPVDAFNEKYAARVEKLWKALRLTETAEVPFVISMLGIAKGKKLMPRIIRQLNHDQDLTLLTTVIGHFTKLQVCRYVIYPGTTVANVDEAKKQLFVTFEDVELFMNTAAPPLLAFIAEAPLRIIDGLLQFMLDKNDILMIAQTKPGLAFLTMLLSRAEILKQGGGSLQGLPPPTPEEISRWQELYGNLFNSLKGRYLAIFPSLYYLVPLNPNTPMMQLSLAVDDMYVWQFLAAMAVGASMDQQHILVTEVRDRVMDNIVLAKRNRLPLEQASHRISNVNLFLHALGLDASQVSIPL